MKGKGCSSGGGSGETFSSTVVFKRKGKKEAGHLEGADSSNDSILVRIQVIQPPPLFPGHSSFLFLFSVLYFWLRWVFISAWASSSCGNRDCSVALSGLWVCGLRSCRTAHRLSCSEACGIFPDQGSNRCPLYWQTDS